MNEKSEQKLQIKLCSYIKNFYPNVYFSSDPSGLRVTPGLRSLLKATRSSHAQLDVTILEPSRCGLYHGLIIECKKETPYKQNGELKEDQHLKDQLATMNLLEFKGFRCQWCWDYETGVAILNGYLGKPIADHLKSIIDGSPYLK